MLSQVLATAPKPAATVELLEQVEVHGRTFVLRRHPFGKFPFEVSEQLGNSNIARESYRLLSLGQMDLARRVRETKPRAPFPLCLVVDNDPERPDRFRMENLPDTYGRYGSER